MTSRLKKRLDNLGVDPSSAKLTENFCLIGTPLPSLEKSKDSGEFVPVWKQEVRDEQGRRRLHGAFTGGFSAGYYNTVGSKEGWTPSTFISSRTSRAAKGQKGSRPEDYMDDEDLAELRDSQKMIDTTEEMDVLGGTGAEMRRRADGMSLEKDSVASALESLIPTVRDSVGARLLQKMGWRLGSGIGPRVTYTKRKLQDQLYSGSSTSAPPDDEEDAEAGKHLYAPRDTKVILAKPKDNSFGLGYEAGQGLRGAGESSRENAKKGPNISAGFGLGALNDADMDDLDVYDGGLDQGESRRLAYDAGDDDEERIVLGATQARDKSARYPPSTAAAHFFHDGRPVLAGFALSDKPVMEDKWFALPEIPKGWKPNPQSVWAQGQENLEQAKKMPPPPPPRSGPDKWKAGAITADERGAMLGEAKAPAPPRSVFDYLSEKDRERLQNIKAGVSVTEKVEQPTPIEPPQEIIVPTVEPRTAQAALQGFQPFTTDPPKQARYTAYLKSQASSSAPPLAQKPGQSVDEFNKELSDFAKSAMIFKPISGAMANRFTSASIIESGPKAQEGLYKPAPGSYLTTPDETEKEEEKVDESPKAHAARAGMFGPLTRETQDWFPMRLLCKRFGVKDPHPDGPPAPSGGSSSQAPQWDPQSAFSSMPTQSHESAPRTAAIEDTPRPGSASAPSGKKDLANIGLGEDESQGKDTLTYERPTMDIFKAIFASDEEDSDDEEEMPVEVQGQTPYRQPSVPSAPTAPPPIASEVIPRAPSPPLDETPPDPATFRPTFVPRAEREGKRKGKDKESDKKEKKGKSKKMKTVLVSFGDDEMADDLKPKKPKKRSRAADGETERETDKSKKKRPKEDAPEDDEEDMWVEKPPPTIAQPSGSSDQTTLAKGRMRASDFL